MKTCDIDRTALVDNEVIEAIEYDFVNESNDDDDSLLIDPAIPFCHDLTSVLHPQSDIVVQGVIDENAIRFAINLVTGRNERPDIAFHFNPRLDQLYSARNSRLDGSWGHEEGNSQHRFPFSRGQPFYIEVFLTHSEFLVAVNGTHYCSYTYRTSLINITSIQIVGGVKLSRVHLRNCHSYPSPMPSECTPCPYRFPLHAHGATKNLTEITPVYGFLQENLKLNSEIEISGRVKLLPFSFFINLQEGGDIWPHPEIPLHVSVRFSQRGDHVILANAWTQTAWGREEFASKKCLFTPGYPFTVKISCLDDAFVTMVDDEPLLVFKHRVPYTNINTLHIQGDVYIYDISIRS